MSHILERASKSVILLAASLLLPGVAVAASTGNPLCPGEEVSFNPGNGEDIVVPDGFKVSVFASGLNFPTGIAFRGNSQRFEVYILESGAFPASRCNSGVAWQQAQPPLMGNPFTPDVLVFDQNGKQLGRFAPHHPLAGGLLVGENGADDVGARPSNNPPDVPHLARQNLDGTPDYHGWPDRYGFLPTSQAVFNPIGGPAEDGLARFVIWAAPTPVPPSRTPPTRHWCRSPAPG